MSSAAAACRVCRGVGLNLVGADGLCAHCRRASAGVKRPRPEPEAASGMTPAELQAMLDAADSVEMPALDAGGVKRMLLKLERAISTNVELRAKHGDEPPKFMASESALDVEVKGLQALAAAPGEYGTLVRSGSLASLLALLAHENADIAIDVLQLFAELLREDVLEEAGEEAGPAMARALLGEGGAELLISGLTRLDDAANSDDAAGIFAALELFGSLVDILGEEAATALCAPNAPGAEGRPGPPALFAFLLSRLERKETDDVKEAAAEVLSVLASTSTPLAARLGGGTYSYLTSKGARMPVDGVEFHLQLINAAKKKGPAALSAAEKEIVENVMDALSSCLLEAGNRDRFRAAEGFELLLRVIHENGYARAGSLKAIDFALGGSDSAGAFVEAGGLKALFPAFMGKGLGQTRRWHGAEAAEGEEERALSAVCSCLQGLLPPPGSTPPVAGDAGSATLLRLLAKLREGEKTDRLLELRAKYSSMLQAAEEEGEEGEGGASPGLFSLQRVDLTLGRLLTLPARLGEPTEPSAAGASPLLAFARDLAFAVRAKLYEQGASVVALLDTVKAYTAELGGPVEGVSRPEQVEGRWLADALQLLLDEAQ
jgi:beta-catenin-like protein 1